MPVRYLSNAQSSNYSTRSPEQAASADAIQERSSRLPLFADNGKGPARPVAVDQRMLALFQAQDADLEKWAVNQKASDDVMVQELAQMSKEAEEAKRSLSTAVETTASVSMKTAREVGYRSRGVEELVKFGEQGNHAALA